MPIVTVSGIPQEVSDTALQVLRKQIQLAVSSVEPLRLTISQTTVEYPVLRCLPEKPQIIARVIGLFDKPERTNDARQQMCDAIGRAIHLFAKRYCPYELIEVLPDTPFNEKAGFCRFGKE